MLSRYHDTAAARVKVAYCYRNTLGPAPTLSHRRIANQGNLPVRGREGGRGVLAVSTIGACSCALSNIPWSPLYHRRLGLRFFWGQFEVDAAILQINLGDLDADTIAQAEAAPSLLTD